MAGDFPKDIRNFIFPIPITNVDIDQPIDNGVLALSRRTLFIFLADGLPVGQAYVDTSDEGPRVDIAALVAANVSPDMLRRARINSAPASASADVSLLICTRDRPDDLARCLADLHQQTLRPREVIVVDNASSDDRTKEVVAASGAIYVREDRAGLSHARNAALRHASCEIVVFTDDDVIFHPRWLEQLVAAFDAPDIACVTGLVLPAELSTPAQLVFETQWGFGRGYARLDFGPEFYERHLGLGCPSWEIGAGANMAFRRAIFDEVGLFDTRLGAGASGCSEDSELWNRILFKGKVCRYEPLAVVWHFHRKQLRDLKRQIYAYMKGHAAALGVQFQATGERGNLHRAFLTLRKYYWNRLKGRIRRGPNAGNFLIFHEIQGYIMGLIYILLHWSPRKDDT